MLCRNGKRTACGTQTTAAGKAEERSIACAWKQTPFRPRRKNGIRRGKLTKEKLNIKEYEEEGAKPFLPAKGDLKERFICRAFPAVYWSGTGKK